MNEARRRFWKRILIGELSVKRLAGSVAFIYGTLAVFALLGSDRILFQPHAPSAARGDGETMIHAAGGARIAVRLEETPGARYTILLSHGNAEDVADMAPLTERLRGLGASVLTYDYEGYGHSEGSPSEARVYADIDAAYAYLTEERKIPPRRVVLYGRSLGGGPSVDLASRRPVGGLILESTFTSAFRVITRIPLFPGDRFQSLSKMDRVTCPVLILHGRRDRVIPFHHGEALFAAARGAKRALWLDGADHGDVPFVEEERYDDAIRGLLSLIE